jgi:type I restriction enzyme S subunit
MSDEQGVVDPDGILRTSPEIAESYRRSTIRTGDLVCSIGPSFGKVMVTPDWLDGGNLTQGTARVAVQEGDHPRFVFWALRSPNTVAQWDAAVGGATFRALNLGPLSETTVPRPPLDEQAAIAAFLDRETAKIDALVDEQRRLIELLTEKRRAVISHAVTKGLDPDAPMKPSGIDWLGEMPEHWEVMQLRRVLQGGVSNGIFKKKEDFGTGVLLVNVFDIYTDDYRVKFSSLDRVQCDQDEIGKYAVGSGDLFFVRSSLKLEGIAVVATVDTPREPSVFECHLVRARPDPHRLIGRFASFCLNADLYRDYFISKAKITTMTTVDQESILSAAIPIPPIDEQCAIASFLDEMLTEFGELTHRSQDAIRLLQERRTALISAAVTGKIDVRGAVPAAEEVAV